MSPAGRRPPLPAVVVLGLAALGLVTAGCSGSSSKSAPAAVTGTTVVPTTEVLPTTETVPSTTSTTAAPTTTTTTTPAQPGSPSSLPPVGPSVTAVCSKLGDLVAMGDLSPRDTGDWNQEQRRVTTDASLDVAILGALQPSAPTAIASALGAEKAYAQFVVTTVSSATSYAQATQGLAAYPDRAALDAAVATVAGWQRANC